MENAISILIASGYNEDCKRIITSLSDQNDFYIFDVEKDESNAIIKSACLQPDVLILDLPFSGVSISDLAPIIHRRSPVTAIIVLCDMNKEKYGYTAFSAGVSGFLIKEADMDKLSSVVKIVSSGGYFFSTPIIIKVFNNFMSINQFPGLAQTDHKFNLHLLSPAEHSIVTLIAQGFQDEEIARYLNLSTGTIRNCITAIKRKTKLKNRIQIVIFSIFFGIISTEQLNFLKINSYKDQFNRQILNDQIQ